MTGYALKIVFLLSLMAACGMQSCVDRVTVPEDNEGMLFINCEMMTGSTEVTATLATSTNFNSNKPISNPTEAIIRIKPTGQNIDDQIQLKYDEQRELYYKADVNTAFWNLGNGQFRLEASVPSNDFPEISAKVNKLPTGGVTTIREVGTTTLTTTDHIQKEIEIILAEPKIRPAYYYIELSEALTVASVNGEGETVLTSLGASLPVVVDAITVGGAGLVALTHRPGVLIDQSRLLDNTFTLLVTSAHEQQAEDQVFQKVDVEVHAIDKNFYDYHKAYSNTISSSGDQYIDPAIWSNNIVDGVGLFSLNTITRQSLTIEQ